MSSEDVISVVISASREIDTDGMDKKDKFTNYTVIVRNHVTNIKYIVKRRYSDFYKLRKELIEIVSWGHCRHCDQYAQEITSYPFPRRHLLRIHSSHFSVIKERMDSLQLFLRHLLLCMMHKTFDACASARENLERCLLRSFLEIDQVDKFVSTSTKKPHMLKAMEEQRQKQMKLAGLRAQATRSESIPPASQPVQVDADTCAHCQQKWTHCYCNDDQDVVFPRTNPLRSKSSPSDVDEWSPTGSPSRGMLV